MAILKLQEVGEEMTLEIVTAEIVQGNFGQQVKFSDKGGDDLYVPLSSVERQLDRCGVAEVEDLNGKTIHFSRAASNKPGGKPFWNLDKARSGDVVKKAAPATNGKAAVQEPVSVGRLPGDDDTPFDEMLNSYGECLVAAQKEIAPALKRGNYEVTTENLLTATACLFIERRKRGI